MYSFEHLVFFVEQDRKNKELQQKRTKGVYTQNISFFKVIDDFAQALATDDEDALNLGLEEISSITEGMGASIADLGARISTVSNQREILEDTNLRYQDLLSNAQDLDYATAVTKLSAELLSLEAAQASFAKISQLSLFNYIR